MKRRAMANNSSYFIGPTLSLRVPVMQATLGACDGPRLAAAVSRAGGLGCLTVHHIEDFSLTRRLRLIRSQTTRPIVLSFTRQWQRDSILDIAIAENFRHFQVFWWNGPRLAPQIRKHGGTVLWQVGTPPQAQEAIDCGADILVLQGTEAGGQVRSPYNLRQLITGVQSQVGENVPLIAGGGLATRHDVAQVLSWGASAALLGTRFLLSEESAAPADCKARLLRASTDDLHLDPRMVGDWPCAPRRRLLTAREQDTPAHFAGRGLTHIAELLPACEIVRRLGQ